MRKNIVPLAISFLILISCGCKKQAPYIDNLAGTYKINGTVDLDTNVVRNITDSIVIISKKNSTTLEFITAVCDTSGPVFISVDLSYGFENDTLIQFICNQYGDHSPDAAYIFFHNPPNGNFNYFSNQYCDPHSMNCSLSGMKVY